MYMRVYTNGYILAHCVLGTYISAAAMQQIHTILTLDVDKIPNTRGSLVLLGCLCAQERSSCNMILHEGVESFLDRAVLTLL